jgi:glycosyltransferase involved in cell wall biosynthesis
MVMRGYKLRYMPDVLIKSRTDPDQGSTTACATQIEETRAFYELALQFVGPRERVENAAGPFRVLLMKRLSSPIGQLFRLLGRDRMKGWNTLGQTETGAKLWAALSQRLAMTYVARYGIPDVIHAHAALWAGRVAIRTARRLSRPCVVTEHSSQIMRGDLQPTERGEAARVYSDADAVLAVSSRLIAAVRMMAPVRTSRAVPNAVDFDFFDLPPAPRPVTPFTFISVSNLVAGKRLDALIRAFARASLVHHAIRLVIVGAGVDAGALQRLACEAGVAARVEFTGSLPPQGVRERMWKANALVMPSAFETFGVVLFEALATGIPVVATRCGGPEDIVDESVGLLVRTG